MCAAAHVDAWPLQTDPEQRCPANAAHLVEHVLEAGLCVKMSCKGSLRTSARKLATNALTVCSSQLEAKRREKQGQPTAHNISVCQRHGSKLSAEPPTPMQQSLSNQALIALAGCVAGQ